jgi:hypothetical protein
MTARSRVIRPLSACVLALLASRASGAPLSQARVMSGVDWTAAGVGGVGAGAGIIALSGVSGTVEHAFLYWHGIDQPQEGGDGVYDNEAVTFAGHPVLGTPVGDSGANCWPSIDEATGSSRTFRADVTAFVSGDGPYTVSGLSAKPGHSADGASLIVFFDDGNPANDRDVVVFEGNDANVVGGFPGEDDGWHAALTGILYSGGSVSAQFHVADGQIIPDNALTLTSSVGEVAIPDTAALWDGASVQDAGTSRAANGSLWDIHSIDATGAFPTPGQYGLSVDGQTFAGNDCLSLVVLLLDFRAGSVPPPTTTSTTSTTISTLPSTTTIPPGSCGNGSVEPGEECDLGAAANGTPGVCCAATCTFRPAGEECRSAASPCDLAEACGGSSAACPADATRDVEEVCDDGDPETGISACNEAHECTGVSTAVTLQPETRIPRRRRRKRVKIPLKVAVPGAAGRARAKVQAEGLVDCRDVPADVRPSCGPLPVLLRVTLRVKRSLGARQTRPVSMDLPLTKLGRQLLARLGPTERGLTVQVRCRLGDHRGRQIDVRAPTVLKLEP